MTEDEMVGWHHQLNGHEFEQSLGDGEGQGSLASCSPWGRKKLDMTKRLTQFRIMVLEKPLESPLDNEGIQTIHPKGNQP